MISGFTESKKNMQFMHKICINCIFFVSEKLILDIERR